MKVLVIGSGGREHALCWGIAKSPDLEKLYCAPGNGGIAAVADCVDLDASHHGEIIEFCRDNDIGLVVVGPEVPLVEGLADALVAAGIDTFGPSAAAARLEGSKSFTKELCAAHNIPTAAFGRFSDAASAKVYVETQGAPIVVKADGLAAGKGVIVAQTIAEAQAAIDDCFSGAFGDAGAEVVIEEMLVGEEASFFALSDGKTVRPLATAQDHKRVGDGDTGPNTGGMGAYSPAPVMSDSLCARTMTEIIEPTVAALAAAGTPYKGVLFAGLMITAKGPELIEYNVRFGDPECQVLVMRLKSDLLGMLAATARGTLASCPIEWDEAPALTVVMANRGYPGSYKKGSVIGNLEEAGDEPGVHIFHAGTACQKDTIVAIGGRVLNVTAKGDSVSAARSKAYDAAAKLDWPRGFCRSDIGWRAVQREQDTA